MSKTESVVLSEADEIDAQLHSLGHAEERECPCGCRQLLRAHNGRRNIVCFLAWRLADSVDKFTLMMPGTSIAERRDAARNILRVAARMRAARSLTQTLALVD